MGDTLVVIVGVVLAAAVVVVLALRGRRRLANGGAPSRTPDARTPRHGGPSGCGGTDDGDDSGPLPPRSPAPGDAHPPGGDGDARPAPSPDPASARPEAPTTDTVGSLLRGIDLPCGLAPHVAADHPDPDRYVSLVSTEALPLEVARAMTAELERLGFEVHGLSEDDLVARRGDELLSLRVHARADTAQRGGTVPFPGAPPTAVVVELWVGAGPSPGGT